MYSKVIALLTIFAYAEAIELGLGAYATHAIPIAKVEVSPVAQIHHVAATYAHATPVPYGASSYSSVNNHITHAAPVAVAHVIPSLVKEVNFYSSANNHISHAAPIVQASSVAEYAPVTHVAPIAHAAPVAHYAPTLVKDFSHASSYSSINNHLSHAAPIAHADNYAPVTHVAPVVKAVHQEVYPDAHPHYSFEYGVKDSHTHDMKNQHEERDGDVVKGYYSLVQPDGVTRTVHYAADHHNGFNAQVEYKGHAVHPEVVAAKAIYAHH